VHQHFLQLSRFPERSRQATGRHCVQLGWGVQKPDPNVPVGMTPKQWKDSQYQASLSMLTFLGLQNYHQNLKRGLLTDNTIMLWNDSVLQEIKIPPGPRCVCHVAMRCAQPLPCAVFVECASEWFVTVATPAYSQHIGLLYTAMQLHAMNVCNNTVLFILSAC
jgi:hypothetical protein